MIMVHMYLRMDFMIEITIVVASCITPVKIDN